MTREDAEKQYKEYLEGHIGNVVKALEILYNMKIPFVIDNIEELRNIVSQHDKSKYEEPEWTAYLHHFYPLNDKESKMEEEFDSAVRHHIKNNKHHWDYWIDDKNGSLIDNIDEHEYKLYTIERICDWLAMAGQHEEGPHDYYDVNIDWVIQPDYARALCDEIFPNVPDNFSDNMWKGNRGELDESTINNKDKIRDEYYNDDGEYVIDLKSPYVDPANNNYIIEKNKKEAYNILKQVTEDNTISDKINTTLELIKNATSDKKEKISSKLGCSVSELENEIKDRYSEDVEIIVCNTLRKDREEYFNESIKSIERTGNGYLVEANIRQLKRTTLSQDPTRAKKSKNIQSKYIGISKYGVLNFETTSETHSTVKWYQELHFPSFNGFLNIIEQGDEIDENDVKMAIFGSDVKLSCDDPSFLYWSWKYKAWRDSYGLEKETRAPKRNNTRLQGALCKHLYSVVELLGESRILKLITRDLNEFCKRQLGLENQGYQDPEGMMNKDMKANQYDYNVEDVLKGILPKDKFEKYQDGAKLEDLELTDEEMKEIDDAIKNMRDRSQFALKTELEKQFTPAKRGRKITRDDKKLEIS